MTHQHYLSACCNALVEVMHGGEGTSWWKCSACSKPCNITGLKMSKGELDTTGRTPTVVFSYEYIVTQEEVRKHIKTCEGKHTQQVAYSTFHDSLTQVCFGCKVIRTNIYMREL